MHARDLLDLLWLIPAFPASGAVVLLLFGKRLGDPASGWIASAMVSLSLVGAFAMTIALFTVEDDRFHQYTLWTWLRVGGLEVDFGFLIDPLSVVMIMIITLIGALIHFYAIGYMHGDPRFGRFFAYMNLFVAAMLVLVMGSNFLVTFLGWEGVGLCSYLLISFWFERDSAAVAGTKAFITNRVGDVGFLLAMFLIFVSMGTLDYSALPAVTLLPTSTATAIAALLLIAAIGKSAQFPLHVWLPDAMEGPTPVSALIHAATMVTAGVFVVSRAFFFFEAGSVGEIMAWIGGITALGAAGAAVVQNDIKRVLAYSTISQLGYMFLAAGLGAYSAAMFHMATHAAFKALLFLAAGSVIHGLGDEQDMRRMGGLRRYMPVTAGVFIVGWLAIAGVIPLAGFWSKDEILVKAWFSDEYALWAIGTFTALLTAFYMTRQVWLVFFANERWQQAPAETETAELDDDVEDAVVPAEPVAAHAPRESPPIMLIPLVALAGLTLVGGFVNLPFTRQGLEFLSSWLEPIFEPAGEVHPDSFVGAAGLATFALFVALLGIVAGVAVYRRGLDRRRGDPTAARLGAFGHALEKAYYVDAAYAWVVAKPGRAAFDWLTNTFDAKVVDGAVNGVGRLARAGGLGLRVVQTGRVRNYALAIVAGAVLLLAYMITRSV